MDTLFFFSRDKQSLLHHLVQLYVSKKRERVHENKIPFDWIPHARIYAQKLFQNARLFPFRNLSDKPPLYLTAHYTRQIHYHLQNLKAQFAIAPYCFISWHCPNIHAINGHIFFKKAADGTCARDNKRSLSCLNSICTLCFFTSELVAKISYFCLFTPFSLV